MSNSQSQNQAESAEKPQQKPQVLEEDDEFEDFPVEDWPQEEAEQASGNGNGGDDHLWEESWDDNAEAEEFSKQLKEELKKVEAH